MTVKLPVYNLSGEVVRHLEASDDVFAVPFNEALVHQAMLRQRANGRQGTHDTKTRGQVTASGRKLFRQKGTGNARAGSRKSPLRRGGGVVFGPHPRDYRQAMPKKMRRLAIRCLLSDKAGSGALKLVDDLSLTEVKTREMAAILKALGVESTALIATEGVQEGVVKSARNLSRVKTSPAGLLNVLDLLNYDTLLMTESAVQQVENLWGAGEAKDASV